MSRARDRALGSGCSRIALTNGSGARRVDIGAEAVELNAILDRVEQARYAGESECARILEIAGHIGDDLARRMDEAGLSHSKIQNEQRLSKARQSAGSIDTDAAHSGDTLDTSVPHSAIADDAYFSPQWVGKRWGCHARTVRNRFRKEADVLNISLPPRRGYHAYESLKISGKALKRKEREMQAANRNRKAIK